MIAGACRFTAAIGRGLRLGSIIKSSEDATKCDGWTNLADGPATWRGSLEEDSLDLLAEGTTIFLTIEGGGFAERIGMLSEAVPEELVELEELWEAICRAGLSKYIDREELIGLTWGIEGERDEPAATLCAILDFSSETWLS